MLTLGALAITFSSSTHGPYKNVITLLDIINVILFIFPLFNIFKTIAEVLFLFTIDPQVDRLFGYLCFALNILLLCVFFRGICKLRSNQRKVLEMKDKSTCE